MKLFIHKDFCLETAIASTLYHKYAKELPIIDYHCHLSAKDIAENKQFANLTEIWLGGDHYKWRAMRANGVDERFITGNAPDEEKFYKWAETVPYCLRNPLYHWTHLELNNLFGISALLNADTARDIYQRCSEMLSQKEFSAQNIIRHFNVETICTTDDPVDNLQYHEQIRNSGFETKVLPAWRPDKVIAIEEIDTYNTYLDQLSVVAETKIDSFNDLLCALKKRQQYFYEHGCRLSDHGLEHFYAEDYTSEEIKKIFDKIRSLRQQPTKLESNKFKSAMMVELARMNHAFGWVQQFHYGPIRSINTRKVKEIGEATGFDSMGDFNVAKDLARYLNCLESTGQLTKTILYNINPKDNDMLATIVGSFQDGSIPGKIQLGSGWWFLDQKTGMEAQMNSLSNQGLLSRFVGMLTDSRSFLSYSRHEYFRRILCNLLGSEVEKGLLPDDIELIGSMVKNICYFNAKNYFNF